MTIIEAIKLCANIKSYIRMVSEGTCTVDEAYDKIISLLDPYLNSIIK